MHWKQEVEGVLGGEDQTKEDKKANKVIKFYVKIRPNISTFKVKCLLQCLAHELAQHHTTA